MPRDGSGTYSYPAGGDASSGATISSSAYNARFADLLTDLNANRPLEKGGTGASLTDPAGDRLLGYDLSDSAAEWMTLGTGLAITVNELGLDSSLTDIVANPLTAAELQQLQNIGAVTVSAAQWGYLGAMGAQPLEPGNNLSDVSNATTAAQNLGLEIGVDVQAYDADLATYAGNPLSSAELDQLQNINSVTITNTQWGYLGAMGGQPLESGAIGSTVQAWDADLDTYAANPL